MEQVFNRLIKMFDWTIIFIWEYVFRPIYWIDDCLDFRRWLKMLAKMKADQVDWMKEPQLIYDSDRPIP